jgi:hypothetical protein
MCANVRLTAFTIFLGMQGVDGTLSGQPITYLSMLGYCGGYMSTFQVAHIAEHEAQESRTPPGCSPAEMPRNAFILG